MTGPTITDELSRRAEAAIAEAGGKGVVTAVFRSPGGAPSRHPVLEGGEGLNEKKRDQIAKAVARTKGVGGISWADGNGLAEGGEPPINPRHCQDDVRALLAARTIRFEESSATIQPSSVSLIDEVAKALRPCLGSVVLVTGHTDKSGPEKLNQILSRDRAESVRNALIARGLPEDSIRAEGVGSAVPVDGLNPADPANRRIDFEVIQTAKIKPTPVDTPGPH
ncbi:OmpA family protein [Altericroceibacterium indicum]|uniref:OmpA family protein n=1 Tax=Altericroceibacterium indicum TaxID=374177 RepID=UPI001FEC04BB|nr:OmpA family protein [Altericroceibacterium indicum]